MVAVWCWISGARSATNPDAAAAAEGGLAGGLAVMAAGALTGLLPHKDISSSLARNLHRLVFV